MKLDLGILYWYSAHSETLCLSFLKLRFQVTIWPHSDNINCIIWRIASFGIWCHEIWWKFMTFGGIYCLLLQDQRQSQAGTKQSLSPLVACSCLASFLTLRMEAVFSSETSLNTVSSQSSSIHHSPQIQLCVICLLIFTASLSAETLQKFRNSFYADTKNILAQNVCTRVDPLDVCMSRKHLEETQHVFTHKVWNRFAILQI